MKNFRLPFLFAGSVVAASIERRNATACAVVSSSASAALVAATGISLTVPKFEKEILIDWLRDSYRFRPISL